MKIYTIMIDGNDGSLENGEFLFSEAMFTTEENANAVCNFLNSKLKSKSKDTFLIGNNEYYIVEDYVYERYFVKEDFVYKSMDEYFRRIQK